MEVHVMEKSIFIQPQWGVGVVITGIQFVCRHCQILYNRPLKSLQLRVHQFEF